MAGEGAQQSAQRIGVGAGPFRQLVDVLGAGHQVGQPQRGGHPDRYRCHQIRGRSLDLTRTGREAILAWKRSKQIFRGSMKS